MRILIIDDDPGIIADLMQDLPTAIGEPTLELESVQSFVEASALLSDRSADFDLIILDVRNQAEGEDRHGAQLYEDLIDLAWVPVVFYTAVPQEVGNLSAPPLISVVKKDAHDDLFAAVKEALDSNAAELARDLTNKVSSRIRAFLGRHVAPRWSSYGQLERTELLSILISRAAADLRDWSDQREAVPVGHVALPAYMYLFPPISQTGLRTGSILVDPSGDRWVVLTPTCDLFTNQEIAAKGEPVRLPKADLALVASVLPASKHPDVADWVTSPSAGKEGVVKQLLRNAYRDRWYYLPAFIDVEHGFVDFESVRAVPVSEAAAWDRLADMDSPFAESMLVRHAAWRGRIGTPDLETEQLWVELKDLLVPTGGEVREV